jgi:hypothetical protein
MSFGTLGKKDGGNCHHDELDVEFFLSCREEDEEVEA